MICYKIFRILCLTLENEKKSLMIYLFLSPMKKGKKSECILLLTNPIPFFFLLWWKKVNFLRSCFSSPDTWNVLWFVSFWKKKKEKNIQKVSLTRISTDKTKLFFLYCFHITQDTTLNLSQPYGVCFHIWKKRCSIMTTAEMNANRQIVRRFSKFSLFLLINGAYNFFRFVPSLGRRKKIKCSSWKLWLTIWTEEKAQRKERNRQTQVWQFLGEKYYSEICFLK